jgi:hypothetical protein
MQRIHSPTTKLPPVLRAPRLIYPLVLSAAAALSAMSCSGASNDGASAEESVADVAAAERLPADDLIDWVSYADAVVAVTVTSEAELPPTPEEAATGEGLLLRDVSVQVDETLWSHALSDSLPEDGFVFTAVGWTFNDDSKVPARTEGAERLEVGRRYVMPITYWPQDDQWGPIAPSAVVALDAQGRLAASSSGGATDDATLPISGLALTELAETLASTAPNPVAEANRGLDPVARFNAVDAAEGSG